MALRLKHFDPKLQQDLDIEEQIDNSLAEYLFPDTEFALSAVYPDAATPEDLGEYKGKTLQFASGERMFFADQPVRELLYPTSSDGAAYGSLVFTACKSLAAKSARVLVVDDTTGENGGILPPESSKKLVGDCYGKVSKELAEELTGSVNTPFQFRLGIKPQPECDAYRIAKGTLAPVNLDRVGEGSLRTERTPTGELRIQTGYDLVLATSSFKGRKGADAIEPGEYNLTLGIGVKTLARYGEHSLGTQVLVHYPRGVEADILPELKDQAEKLASVQSDPRSLAQYYVEKYERRVQLLEASGTPETPEDSSDLEGLDDLIERAFGNEDPQTTDSSQAGWQDLLLYRLLQADLAGHCQLLEHPKVADALNKFVRQEWVDIATGRAIKFQAGLAQPSLDLAQDQICIPHLPEGEEVIVTRSPLVNANGVIVLTNKYLPQAMHQRGTVHIHPETAAEHLQADFDGDRLAFELTQKYPTLAAEVKEYNLLQNRYRDVVKREKVPYEGSFEQIALEAMENQIGIIANQIQKAVALQWETQLLPPDQKEAYLRKISNHYQRLVKNDANPQNDFQLPPQFRERVEKLANLPPQLSSQDAERSLAEVKKILFDVVGELSSELQVAVDGPKSAARPNEGVLSYCSAISNYSQVGWLKDKKNPEAYLERPLSSTNYSPIDLMVRPANERYQQSQLVPRPSIEFRSLFSGVAFTSTQAAAAREIRDNYNRLIGRAIEREKQAQSQSGPSLVATSALSGRQIEITNLLKFEPVDSRVGKANRLDLKLLKNQNRSLSSSLVAVVVKDQPGTANRPIGTVSPASIREHHLRAGTELRGAQIALAPGAKPAQVKALFAEANRYLESVRQNTPEEEKLAMAAALWHVTFTRNNASERQLKKGSVAFNTYPEQVIERLGSLQFTELVASGIHRPTNELRGRQWSGEKVQCEMVLETDRSNPNFGQRLVVVEGKKLAPLGSESPALPVGTRALATLTSPPGAAVIATTPKGNSLKITRIKNYDLADRTWNGESVQIQVGFHPHRYPRKPPTAVALVEGKVLGVLNADSVEKLKSRNLLQPGVTLSAKLETTSATIAYLKIDPQSVIYPWTQEAAHLQGERTRIVAPIVANYLKLKGMHQFEAEGKRKREKGKRMSESENRPSSSFLLPSSFNFEGSHHTARWNQATQTLSLTANGESSPKLSARYEGSQWHPIPLVQQDERGNVSPRLSEADVFHFVQIAPQIEQKLREQSQQQTEVARGEMTLNQARSIAQTVQSLLNDFGVEELQPDGSLRFESQTLAYHQRGDTISLMAKDGRGEVLRVEGNEVMVCALSLRDLEVCERMRQKVSEKLATKQQQEARLKPQSSASSQPRRGLRL